MNKEDIIMNAVFFGIVILSFALSFHMAKEGIEIDTTPLYWPETFEPYPEDPSEDYYINLNEESDTLKDIGNPNCGGDGE